MNKALRHAHTGRQAARSPGHGVCTHCGAGGSPRGGAEAGSGPVSGGQQPDCWRTLLPWCAALG